MPAAVPSAAPAIAVRGVTHYYRGFEGQLPALTGVDLDVGAGEFVSLVGPSGCGKTTLLRACAGLLEVASGTVRVLAGDPARARRDHAIGLVTQEPGLMPWRNAVDNVALAFELTGASDRTRRAQSLLARVGLGAFANYHPGELSGGMRQRVALARALATAPRLLLMDEPFGALDELSREELCLELLRIWEQARVSVLFVTHSVREAVLLSDRVVVMSHAPGQIVADIAIRLARPRDDAVQDDPDFTENVAQIRGLLRRNS